MFVKFKFKNNLQVFLSLIFLWIVCNIISIVGFYFEYKEFLGITESFAITAITGIFSLPESFCNVLIFWKREFFGGLLFWIAYWICMVFLTRRLFKTKNSHYFLILMIILILSSFFWLSESEAMMGI